MKALIDSKQLGQQICHRRKQQGLTQEQLAATCGVGVRFLRELEKGKDSCHLGKTLQVLRMLGIQLWLDEEHTHE